jgi:hypothetical protein
MDTTFFPFLTRLASPQVLSQHCKALVAGIRALVAGTLEHGRYASMAELEALGAPDCPICYDPYVGT